KSLNAEIVNIMRVKDGPEEYQRPGLENKVMHAHFRIGKANLYTSDAMGGECRSGDNTALNLEFDNREELESGWKNMKTGGKVVMELQDACWGARFGVLQDKFGINWMYNYETKQQ